MENFTINLINFLTLPIHRKQQLYLLNLIISDDDYYLDLRDMVLQVINRQWLYTKYNIPYLESTIIVRNTANNKYQYVYMTIGFIHNGNGFGLQLSIYLDKIDIKYPVFISLDEIEAKELLFNKRSIKDSYLSLLKKITMVRKL